MNTTRERRGSMGRWWMAACAAVLGGCAGPRAVAEPPLAQELSALIAQPRSELWEVVTRYDADRGALLRTYAVESSPARRARMEAFYRDWLAALDAVTFDALSVDAKVDHVLLRNHAARELRRLEIAGERAARAMEHAPFASIVFDLAEGRRLLTPIDHAAAAGRLEELRAQVVAASRVFQERLKTPSEGGSAPVTPSDAKDVLELVEELRRALRAWRGFYDGYDPLFTWWTAEPAKAADRALDEYVRVIREKGVGITSETPSPIVGVPIGREALLSELAFEMIPYTPEELVAIAERELAWCEDQMRRASAEMGLGDDWKAAMERVKQAHVSPGDQPRIIRELALEATAYLKERDLISIPPLAEETWRMEMMTPERQLITPFFTGGEVISVSFPTSGMAHEDKRMSLRGNNVHFSRATVHHELIPGHHLQQFMNSRRRTYRDPFSTAFWTEGWALYWEMVLWDKGFARGPEDRIGMLFWRSHRCARIICSVKYHLGEMTPREWIDFLVDRVGHERANAEGEVRRSIGGSYGPLYQVAYMIGGLQIRSMRRELVDSGRMTEKDFHDAIMRENNMPIEMVRCLVTRTPPPRDLTTRWRFDDAR